MAAAAEPAEGFLASKGGRALAFGCSFTVCLLAAGALVITLLGRPGGPISVSLTLAEIGGTKPKSVSPVSPSSDDAVVAGPVTKLVYAGKAVLADPALIENSVHGPLPRIADDGRKPMTVYAAPAPELSTPPSGPA